MARRVYPRPGGRDGGVQMASIGAATFRARGRKRQTRKERLTFWIRFWVQWTMMAPLLLALVWLLTDRWAMTGCQNLTGAC